MYRRNEDSSTHARSYLDLVATVKQLPQSLDDLGLEQTMAPDTLYPGSIPWFMCRETWKDM